jgi:hypothetical protein
MTAALKSETPDRPFPSRPDFSRDRQPMSRAALREERRRRRRSRSRQAIATPPQVVDEKVVRSLSQPELPAWLQTLIRFQRLSSAMTLGLMGLALAVYGWTVYTQQRWGEGYRKLEALEKQEQQMTATNEILKNQMARQAESQAGLISPDPSSLIFTVPAPPRAPIQPDVTSPTDQPIPNRPLGY